VLSGWRIFPLQLDAPAAVQFAALPDVSAPSAAESGPVFYRRRASPAQQPDRPAHQLQPAFLMSRMHCCARAAPGLHIKAQ